MSALDLFAAAMGAFMLIALICLPYYMTTDRSVLEEIDNLKNTISELEEAVRASERDKARIQKALEEAEKQKAEAEKQLADCEETLSQTYLVVIMKWATSGKVDIDLHVTDAAGNEFYFKAPNRRTADGRRPHFPDADAELSIDMTTGPGIEVWESLVARPGTYTVAYKYYSGTSPLVEVAGSILHRGASHVIPPIRLVPEQKKTAATIIVETNGNITIR